MAEKIITRSQLINYFKAVATGLKPLNPGKGTPHFYEFQEFFTGRNLSYPAMIMLPVENKIDDSLSDNILKQFSVVIWILDNVKKDDLNDRIKKLSLTEQITEQVIAKIKKDQADFSLGSSRPFFSLDLSSIKYSELGPEQNDNLHGHALEFSFENPKSFTLDLSLWH